MATIPVSDPAADSAAKGHPPWCDPASCEVTIGNGHSSSPVKIASDRQSPARIQVRMWQMSGHWVGDAPVWVEVVTGEHGSGVRLRVDLSTAQAAALRTALDQLAQVDTDR
jgi:hypothetical protein